MVLLRRSLRISNYDRRCRLCILLFVFIVFLNILVLTQKSENSNDPMVHRGVQDLIKDRVYGDHDLFDKPGVEVDKILIITYSNQGLDVASAVLSDHPDIWYLSAKFPNLVSLEESARQVAQLHASKFATQALNCNLNSSQIHLVQKRSMDHKCVDSSIPERKVQCMNSLCQQKGIQIFALRDIKLMDLQPVLWLFENRLKIILIQETPQPEDTKLHYARMCERLMSDSEKCAELEGRQKQKVKHIHTVYFLNDFASNWFDQALAMMEFIGLDPHSMHTKLAIKKNPLKFAKKSKNNWMDIISSCRVK